MINKIINRETILYIIVGICTTLVNVVCFYLLYKICHIDTTISNIISVAISILFAFITNKIFVFESRKNKVKEIIDEMIKFCGGRLSTMIIEVGGVYVLIKMHIHPMIAKLATQFIVIVLNYFISKFLVFKK